MSQFQLNFKYIYSFTWILWEATLPLQSTERIQSPLVFKGISNEVETPPPEAGFPMIGLPIQYR